MIGIDLGTTNSCVAVVDETGRPEVLSSREGYASIPSVVSVTEDGDVLVGHGAKRQVVINPERSVYCSKRLIGRPFDSDVVRDVRRRMKYEIVEGPNGLAAVKLAGRVLSLEQVAAAILVEVKAIAEQHLQGPVHRAVITCPAFYHEHQRAAVRRAGELAGLHVEQVVNEPTAAALAFGYGKGMMRRVAVFDLGGGTFDVTIMQISREKYEVLSTGGDTFLGGDDFDRAISSHLVRSFVQSGVPFPRDPVAYERLMEAAEQAKRELTEVQQAHVHLPYFTVHEGTPRELEATITRETFEALCAPLLDRAIAVVDGVLGLRGMSPLDIDDVLLVGGMTRMPLVQERVRDYFGRQPLRGVHPDEAVAQGAAILAHSLETDEGIELIDVLPMSIGIALPTGRFKKLVPRNTKLPVQRSYTIPTTRDNQTWMALHVFQGESDDAYQNERLGVLRLTHLPPGPKGSVKIRISFELSNESLLTIAARELSSQREIEAVMSTKGHEEAGPPSGAPLSSLGDGLLSPLNRGEASVIARPPRPGLWARFLDWLRRFPWR